MASHVMYICFPLESSIFVESHGFNVARRESERIESRARPAYWGAALRTVYADKSSPAANSMRDGARR